MRRVEPSDNGGADAKQSEIRLAVPATLETLTFWRTSLRYAAPSATHRILPVIVHEKQFDRLSITS